MTGRSRTALRGDADHQPGAGADAGAAPGKDMAAAIELMKSVRVYPLGRGRRWSRSG